ncbi:MAG: MarR family winged helix-turn-helix transcriptional regulator [Rhodospirillaceae bacterium]
MKDDAAPVETTLQLHDFLPYRLAVLAKAVGAAFAKTYGERFGITNAQWRVMFALGRAPDCSASYVVEHAALDKVQVSRAVAGLIDLRLVARTQDPADRRNSVLNMTTEGWRIYRQIVREALAFEENLVEGLSEVENAALNRALEKLLGQVRASPQHKEQ